MIKAGEFKRDTNYYVYIYTDPRIKGKWQYEQYIFNTQPIYIGNSVATTSSTRYKDHLLPSYLENNNRKSLYLKEMIVSCDIAIKDYIDEYVYIIKCDNPTDTILEKYMVEYFGRIEDGGILLNKLRGKSLNIRGHSIYDGIKLWDMENKCIYVVENYLEELKRMPNLQNLVSGKKHTYGGRFCLFSEDGSHWEYQKRYDMDNTVYTLYKMTDDGELIKLTDKFKNLYKRTGVSMSTLLPINERIRQVHGWYVDKDECIKNWKFMNQMFTLYKYNDETGEAEKIIFKLKDKDKYIKPDPNETKLKYIKYGTIINSDKFYGYYKSKEECLKDNEEIIVYSIVDDEVKELKFKRKDAWKYMPKEARDKLFIRGYKKSKGFYIDKEECIKDNEEIIVYKFDDKIKDVIEIKFKRKDATKILGKGVIERLMRKNCVCSKGYYKDKDVCLSDNKIYTIYTKKKRCKQIYK